MRAWLLHLWGQLLGWSRATRPKVNRQRRPRATTLAFEQLEDRTVPSTFLVRDIRTNLASSDPRYFTEVNGTLFFVANDGSTGRELWKSDGTSTGTVLVKDIRSGLANSYPRYLTNVNGTLFFSANDGGTGYELWKSDGTSTGTMLVKDIQLGTDGSYPYRLTNVNGTLFFAANNGSTGYELWKSDGTSTGTVLVKDIRPGSDPYGTPFSSNPIGLTNVNGTLFFKANDGSTGYELWKSDGTSSGTVLVKDIRPGSDLYGTPFSSNPIGLTNVNGTLFFRAGDVIYGEELWRSDGSSSGTELVKDINSGGASSFPDYLINVNGTLFFRAFDNSNGRELWKSDGTSTGTVLVKDIRSGASPSYPRFLTNVNGTLFFQANDGSTGNELWKSDGTSSGTVLVRDIYPNAANSRPRYLTNVNGTLFFNADDGSNGNELWKSDGTSTGTVLVADIRPGSPYSFPKYLTNVNGTLFFSANDGSTGDELWATTAESASAPSITDITPPGNGTYGVGQHLDFQVQFSETVVVNTSGGTPRLQLTIGSTTQYATYQSGSGSNTLLFRYTVQAGDLDTDGITVHSPLDPNGATIQDNAGNDASLTFTPPDTSGVLVDGVAPTIVSVTPPANGTYGIGQHLDFQVQFSETVVVNTSGGTPRLQLTIGSTTKYATYQSGSGTNTLHFRYTVQSGDLDTDGITVHSPLQLNGGTIRDNAGNDASLTFTPPDTSGVLVGSVSGFGGNVTASIVGPGILRIVGDNQNNGVFVYKQLVAGVWKVIVRGKPNTTVNGVSASSFNLANVFGLEIRMQDGDDSVEVGRDNAGNTTGLNLSRTLTYLGGVGDDELVLDNVTVSKATSLRGNDGDDLIKIFDSQFQHVANIRLDTGSGNEILLLQGSQFAKTTTIFGSDTDSDISLNDTLFAASLSLRTFAGDDNVSLNQVQAHGPATIRLGDGTNLLTLDDSDFTILTVLGGSGADNLTLTNVSAIYAMNIRTGSGNDTVSIADSSFSSAVAVIRLEDGDDSLTLTNVSFRIGAPHNDLLDGGTGNDTITQTGVTGLATSEIVSFP